MSRIDTNHEPVGKTKEGHTIYRAHNLELGGYDYVSDSGEIIISSLTPLSELEVIVADMKKVREKEEKEGVLVNWR